MSIVKDYRQCGKTADAIMQYKFGTHIRYRYLNGEYFGGDIDEEYHRTYFGDLSYIDYVISQVNTQLYTYGICSVHISNDWNINEETMDSTFDHVFILYRHQNNVYRIESYVNAYCSRMLVDNNYESEIQSLLTTPPGVTRINLWNTLFSAHETVDTEQYPLEIVLCVPHYEKA